MRMQTLAAMALATVLAGAGGALAQQGTADERALRDAEKQMREAEKQMRDAQRRLEAAARQLAKLQAGKVKELAKLRTVWFGRRARLGIVVNEEVNPATDSIGAVIRAVTPGGPADEAGLKAGDIITKLDGTPLAGRRSEEDAEESGPGERLIDLASELEDGQKVTVEFRRGNETKTAQLVARRLDPHALRMVTGPDIDIEIPEIHVPGVDVSVVTIPERWLDLELTPLDADLGAYFGAKEGLLVVRAPHDSTLGLKSGDVIVKIGDRMPTTAVQAMRILRSYDPGETVSVEIVRQHARTTLALRLPERKGTTHPPGGPPSPPAAPPAPDDDL